MNAAAQLSMFEPQGAVLANLAKNHAQQADSLERLAEAYSVRGFIATANSFRKLAQESELQSIVCEMALQFEQLAGES